MGRAIRTGFLLIAMGVAGGCGGDDDASSGSGGAATGGSYGSGGGSGLAAGVGGAAAGVGGAAAGVGGAAAGAGGSAQAGSPAAGTGGGSAVGACSGAFGSATLLFDDDYRVMGGLAPTADELEMFYVLANNASNPGFVVERRRAAVSDPFGEPEAVIGLDDPCNDDAYSSLTLDVSEDGLRLYYACTSESLERAEQVFVVQRPTRDDGFGAPDRIATYVGGSLAVSADELALFSNGINDDRPVTFTRTTLTNDFGAETDLPGPDLVMKSVDLSHDGLTLFGSVGSPLQLVASTRSSTTAPFSAPSPAGLPVVPAGYADASAAVSADCRTLYFIRETDTQDYAAYVARR